MAVIRIEKTKDYTVMSNYHLKEKEMSLKAKGLLSLMLSLPDEWDYSIAGLVSICKENETAIKSALKELQQFGYIRIDKITPDKTKSGRIEYIYNIFEKPKKDKEKQEVENLPLEKQCVENHRQLNTKELNTKELKKKNNTKKDFSKLVIDTCLKNDIEDDASIELIEEFLSEMKIKTKGAIEANIAKVAGKSKSTIEECIKTSYERNYKYITPPEWLQNKNNSYNGSGKCSKELAWRTHEQMEEAEEKRQEFIEAVKRNDKSLHHF